MPSIGGAEEGRSPLLAPPTGVFENAVVQARQDVRSTGEVKQPLNLAPGGVPVDDATLTNRRSIGLGEMRVPFLGNREVHLRFTLEGTPLKTFPDPGWAPYPMSAALVTVNVNSAVVHKP